MTTATTIPSGSSAPAAAKAAGSTSQTATRSSSTPFTVRPATPDDAAAIAALGVSVFTVTFGESGCTEEQLQAYLQESYTPAAIRETLVSPTQETILAVSADPTPTTPRADGAGVEKQGGGGGGGERVLGFVLLNTGGPAETCVADSPRHPAPAAELQRLYVALDSHGLGVGTALAAAAERRAREGGFATMWLGVWEHNARAQGLYRRLGFEPVGDHMFDVGGDLQRDLIMAKVL